jgi:hypothetical protein
VDRRRPRGTKLCLLKKVLMCGRPFKACLRTSDPPPVNSLRRPCSRPDATNEHFPFAPTRSKSSLPGAYFPLLQTLKDDLNAKSRDFFPYPGGFTQRNERSPYRQTAAKKENINTVRITPFTCLLLSSSLNLSPLETGVVTVLAPGDCKGSLTGNNGYPLLKTSFSS